MSPVFEPVTASSLVLSPKLIAPSAKVVAAAMVITTGALAITVGLPDTDTGKVAVIVTLFAMVKEVEPVTSPV